MKETKDDLTQYVFWLKSVSPATANTQHTETVWAKTPEEAAYKLRDWEQRGYKLCLAHSMDDFKRHMALEEEFNAKLREAQRQHEKNAAKAIETENV